jgi:hypothetical protein
MLDCNKLRALIQHCSGHTATYEDSPPVGITSTSKIILDENPQESWRHEAAHDNEVQ